MTLAQAGSIAADSPKPRRSWRAETSSSGVSNAAKLQIAVIGLLIVAVYWTPVRGLVIAKWINDPNWSHGWLIPAFSLYFLYLNRAELRELAPRPSYLGAVVLAVSLAANFLFAWVLSMGYPQVVSVVGSIVGAVLLLGGWRLIRLTWFPILFLLLAIPLPQWTYVAVTQPLREWASTAAAALLPLFVPGLHTEAQAVVIDYMLPNGTVGQLNVEEACSGMRLMMAFVTLGLAMAYLGERPLWQRLVMVAFCVPIAVFCNAIRVTMTGFFTVTGHTQLAQGTPHEALGILMLGVALGLYALIGYVLSHLWVESDEGSRA